MRSRKEPVGCAPIARDARCHHLMVTVAKDGRPIGCRLLDIRQDCASLTKELGLRAVAAWPEMAGEGWGPSVRLEKRRLILECHAEGDGRRLGQVETPVVALRWVAKGIAKALRVPAPYDYYVRVLHERTDEETLAWYRHQDQNEDLEIASPPAGQLILPKSDELHFGGLPRGGRVLTEAPGWVRCVFEPRAFEAFLDAAAAEKTHERAWAGLGEAFLDPNSCCVVIRELLELPAAEAGQSFLRTTGRSFAQLHMQAGHRLAAYAHLHPREIDGVAIPPSPSGPDTVVAWNFDMASVLPCVFPIALFGADNASVSHDVAVWAFDGGMLREIQLEVLE